MLVQNYSEFIQNYSEFIQNSFRIHWPLLYGNRNRSPSGIAREKLGGNGNVGGEEHAGQRSAGH